jgi:hypothetical protein
MAEQSEESKGESEAAVEQRASTVRSFTCETVFILCISSNIMMCIDFCVYHKHGSTFEKCTNFKTSK